MSRTLTRGIAAALLAAASTLACRTAPAGTPAPAEDAGITKARADSARLPWTAADARFMSAMIGHHAQALQMARLAPTHEASPTIRTLADRIISAQEDEIATMQRWLRDRRQPVPEVGAAGAHAAMHHGTHDADKGAAAGATGGAQAAAHDALMPGMLTEAQLEELGAARGHEFDRLFLTYMIQHHRGAVAMVDQLFGSYGAAQDETVFKFASDVAVDQKTEIARMQRMLASLELGAEAR